MSLEKALLKIAKQINAYDEASLMSLWERLAERVGRFEPTADWEEAALALALIQGVRMKNQLFNHNLSESRRTPPEQGVDLTALTMPTPGVSAGKGRKTDIAEQGAEPRPVKVGDKRGKLLQLKPRNK
ncbi:MAG: hypothetical protein AB7E32_06240 [Desulfovibrio sp.]